MSETHSIASLSSRLGISRAATLSAIASKRLPIVDKAQVGSRQIFILKSNAISNFKTGLVNDIQRRLQKILPEERMKSATSSALAVMRKEAIQRPKNTTPEELAALLGCTLERASWLLQRHGQRSENGFTITASNWEILIAEQNRLRKSMPVRVSGV